jgi:hypothetical protein
VEKVHVCYKAAQRAAQSGAQPGVWSALAALQIMKMKIKDTKMKIVQEF